MHNMAEIFLYNDISEFTAEMFNRQLSNREGQDVNIRMTTRGGYTPAGVAMISGMDRFTGNIKMSVDGDVSSMGAFMLLYADEVEMSDMAEIMFHKAAYPSWYTPTDSEKENLKRENNRYKKKMEQRLGEAAKELIDEIFKEDVRNDVYLTANKAKKIGLVNKVIKLTPSQKAAYQSQYLTVTKAAYDEYREEKETSNTSDKQKTNKMEITQEELDRKIAEAHAKGYQEGHADGKKAETERQSAWDAFADVDPEAVKKGKASGEEMPRSEELRLLRMASAKDAQKELEEDGAEGAELGEGKEALTDEEQKKAETRAILAKECGVKYDKN